MSMQTRYADFVLLKWHRHNGVMRPPGTTLKLSEELGVWLVSQNIARRSALVVTTSLAAPAPALLQKPKTVARKPRRCCGWG